MKRSLYLSAILIILLISSVADAAAKKKNNDFKLVKKSSVSNNKPETNDTEYYFGTRFEMHYFTVTEDSEEEWGDNDFKDRKYRMEYKFEPVYLASFEGYIKWDLITLSAEYSTNRFLPDNGSVKYNDTTSTGLSDNKMASEMIYLGLELLDFETSLKTVQFDFGTATVLDAGTDKPVETGNIKLTINEASVRYNIPFLIKTKMQVFDDIRDYYLKFFVGYKYREYSLPRIIYYLQDSDPDDNREEFHVIAETSPQQVMTKTHLVGIGIDNIHLSTFLIEPIYNFALYFGAGKTDLYFSSIDKKVDPMMYSLNGVANLGLSLRSKTDDYIFSITLYYQYEAINYWGEEESSGKISGKYELGSTDKMHSLYLKANCLF